MGLVSLIVLPFVSFPYIGAESSAVEENLNQNFPITMIEPEFVEEYASFGFPIAGYEVKVQSEVRNVMLDDTNFVYIVEVKDRNGITVMLNYTEGSLADKESLKVSASWIPESFGRHEIRTFLWSDLPNPVPLAMVKNANITIENPITDPEYSYDPEKVVRSFGVETVDGSSELKVSLKQGELLKLPIKVQLESENYGILWGTLSLEDLPSNIHAWITPNEIRNTINSKWPKDATVPIYVHSAAEPGRYTFRVVASANVMDLLAGQVIHGDKIGSIELGTIDLEVKSKDLPRVDPLFIFDKEEYSPFDSVQMKIIYPPANEDPSKRDTFFATLSTTSGNTITLRFNEIGANTEVFVSYPLKLTPYPELWSGFKVQKNDDLILEFTADNKTFTENVEINFHRSAIKLNRDAFRPTDKMEIIVWELDMNKNPLNIDILPVSVWSTTDRDGITVVLKEMGTNSGIFHGFATLTEDEHSIGNRLRTRDGDTASVKYTDNTLTSANPNPNEVEELFASALIAGPCALCPPMERAIASEPELFKLDGSKQFEVNDEIVIKTQVDATLKRIQPFACIIQVKDSENIVLSLSWVQGELRPNKSVNIETNWIPESSGEYIIEVFVWESVDNPIALSPVRTASVNIK